MALMVDWFMVFVLSGWLSWRGVPVLQYASVNKKREKRETGRIILSNSRRFCACFRVYCPREIAHLPPEIAQNGRNRLNPDPFCGKI